MAGESFDLGTKLFTAVDSGLAPLFSTGLEKLAGVIGPVVGAFVAMYFVFIALNYLYSGTTTVPVGDLAKRLMWMCLFTTFAFKIAYYNQWVVVPIGKIGSEIASAFAVNNSESPQIIDQMGQQIIDTIKKIWEEAPEVSFMDLNIAGLMRTLIAILVVGVCGTIFMTISFLYLMIAKILVSLVLLVGPIFISLGFFPATREYFMRWVSQLMNYVMLWALFGIAFTMLTNILQDNITGIGFTNILLGDTVVIKLLFIYVLFSGVIVAIPGLCSQLTGGVGINSLGAIGPVASFATRGLTKALSGLGKSGGGGKGSGNQIGGMGRNRKLG